MLTFFFKQKSDGSFPEPGRVIHSDMQGQASKGVALTAFIIIAFAQNEVLSTAKAKYVFLLIKLNFQANALTYADIISKGLSYVKTTLDTLDDIYSLAIACYAAQLANHPSKVALLQKLDTLAKVQGNFTLMIFYLISNFKDFKGFR